MAWAQRSSFGPSCRPIGAGGRFRVLRLCADSSRRPTRFTASTPASNVTNPPPSRRGLSRRPAGRRMLHRPDGDRPRPAQRGAGPRQPVVLLEGIGQHRPGRAPGRSGQGRGPKEGRDAGRADSGGGSGGPSDPLGDSDWRPAGGRGMSETGVLQWRVLRHKCASCWLEGGPLGFARSFPHTRGNAALLRSALALSMWRLALGPLHCLCCARFGLRSRFFGPLS